MTVSNSTLQGNFASFSGGAAFVRHSANLSIAGSSLSDNLANIYGAAVYCQENSTVEMAQQTVLERNTALNSGAAVTASGSAQVGGMQLMCCALYSA
jgi:hypothetical protein